MHELRDKKVLILGLGASGRAAADLLVRRGASVTALDEANDPALAAACEPLRRRGVKIELGATRVPDQAVDLAVLSPGISANHPLCLQVLAAGSQVIGEFELGYQQSLCLNVAITGTNGKTTTTELVERLLHHAGRKTVAAGNIGTPVCSIVDQTPNLDILTLEVSSFQLETIQYFRPAVAVLLNLTPDHLDRYPQLTDYARAKARIFMNQQPFDWAIVQSEALAQIRSLKLPTPSKVITFSVQNRRADIYFDRGLLISRLPGWSGPLLDLDDCKLRGPHNAENLMAALAVGRVLRIPLEQMVPALKSYEPPRHRCEFVAELDGIKYFNDSKATNLDAVHKALLSMPQAEGSEPNIWLIAGGKDKGFEFHDIGPLLSQRVKGALLIGQSREKMRAAWSLFTPCDTFDTLEVAVCEASERAVPGDVILLSPACSSFDMFKNYQHRGDVFAETVLRLVGVRAQARGVTRASLSNPASTSQITSAPSETEFKLPQGFLRENAGTKP